MKKIIIGLLAGTTLFTNFNFVFAEETTVEETTVQEEKEEKLPLNIFSKDFPEDYEKFTELANVNKLIYAMEDYFGWDIKEENIEIVGNGLVRLFPEELLSDGRGNSIIVAVEPDNIHIVMQRKFKNLEEKFNFYKGFTLIATSYNDKNDIEDLFNTYHENINKYKESGFPFEILDAFENKLVYSEFVSNSEGDRVQIDYNNKAGIYNDFVLYIEFFYSKENNEYENEGTYKLPINVEKQASSEKKVVYEIYIENPVVEETTVAEVVTTTAPPVEKKFDPSSYETHKYEEVMRDRDGLMLQTWTFYAEVFQYFEREDGTAIALVTKDGDFDQIIMLEFLELPDKRLVEGDTIDVYGRSFGLTDYNTSGNSTNTVPLVIPDKVLIQGIDY